MAEMTKARFAAIVAAYGADPRRWPGDERAAAEAFGREDAAAAALLDREWALDGLLLSHRVPAPSAGLAPALLALRPRPRPWTKARMWWSAVLLGLAGASGALAGSAATAALAPSLVAPGLYPHGAATAFGALDEEDAS